jgi:hypothetical protein
VTTIERNRFRAMPEAKVIEQAASERALAVCSLDSSFSQLRNVRAALRRIQEASFDHNIDFEETQASGRDLLGRAA